MNVAKRINRFINDNNLSFSEFDKSIGTANGYIGKQIKSRGSVGSHIIEKIISSYPNLNVHWLMTGSGDMFYKLKDSIEKRETPNQNKKSKLAPLDFTLMDIGKETVDLIFKTFELYDTSLQMGSEVNALEEIDSEADGKAAENDFTCVRYKGDGMLPTISSGTYMISKKITKSDWVISEDNYMHIVSSAQGVSIGRLVNRFNAGYILLLKNSLDKEKHPDIRINVSEIESMWSVKGYMLSQDKGIYQPENLSTPISTIEEKLKDLLIEVEKLKSELHTTNKSLEKA